MRKPLTIILALVLICTAWWTLRPKGQIQIIIEERLQPNAHTIVLEMEKSIEPIKSFIVAAEQLSKLLKQENLDYILDFQRSDNDFPSSEVANFNIDIKLKKGFIVVSGNFQITSMLDVLYGIFGYYDHQLFVSDYEENTPPKSPRKIKAFIRLHPSDSFGKSIPQDGFLPTPLFYSTTGKYLASFLINRDNNNCTQKLCLSELPDNLENLKATVKAFQYLYVRRNASFCVSDDSDIDCLIEVEKKFAEALKQDAHNNFARLGLGLAQLRHVHLMLQDNSAAAIGRVLMDAIANVSTARNDSMAMDHKYIKNLMENSEWVEMINKTPDLQDYNITPEFIKTADGYRRARRAYVEAKFEDVITELDSIKELPKPLHPHVEHLKLASKLQLADSAEEADPLLEEFRKLEDSESYGTWAATLAFWLCQWSRHHPDRVQEALELFDKAIKHSGEDGITYIDRRVQKATCHASVDSVKDAKNILDDVLEYSLKEHLEHPTEDYSRVYYNIGISYSLVNEMELAGQFLSLAVSAHPSYISGIKQLDRLEKFRDWERYKNWMAEQHQLRN